MARFLKHIGKNHLGSKVVIVFRELPDDPEHCLVVESNSLPDMYHDNIMRTIETNAAQATVDLYEVLSRTRFGDGGQMLNTLHQKSFLKKYPVDQIQVEPMPNRTVSLREVNNQIRQGKGEAVYPAQAPAAKTAVDNPVLVDTQPKAAEVGTVEQKKSLAESKLLQARLMEEDAKRLREEAYELDPDLKKGGRPSKEQAKKVAEAIAEANSED